VATTVSERYGRPPAWRRPLVITGSVVLAVVFLTWLAWAAFVEATPTVASSLVRWDIVDAHTATAQVEVDLDAKTQDPVCTLQAFAVDHTIVGDKQFTPVPGSNQVSVKTDREATSLTLIGCTAKGQDQPR
jgi:hypothetical protein